MKITYRYDLHTHTEASSCSRMDPEELVKAAKKQNLDGIAVTDHDTMENVEEVRSISGSLDIIPGAEITTDEGHILAWYIEEVPDTTDPLKVIKKVHDQRGYTSLAHPKDFLRQSFETEEVYEKTDFVEAVNSRVLPFWSNWKAREKAEKFKKPTSAGSDAHFPFEVGRAVTMTDSKIEEALEIGITSFSGRGVYLSGHIATKANDLLRYLR